MVPQVGYYPKPEETPFRVYISGAAPVGELHLKIA